MINALLITGIGMGLVFIVIMLLWAMMELLVRLLADKKEPEKTDSIMDLPESGLTISDLTVFPNRVKAAAVAVATAIHLRKQQAAQIAVGKALANQKQNLSSPIDANPPSNWQAVMRTMQRQNQQKLFSRTPRDVR